MQNSKTDVIIVKRFSGAVFDDEGSFGIIKTILKGKFVTVDSGGVEVDLNKLAQRVEEATAKWLVESGEVVVPRRLLLKFLDEAIKVEVGNAAFASWFGSATLAILTAHWTTILSLALALSLIAFVIQLRARNFSSASLTLFIAYIITLALLFSAI